MNNLNPSRKMAARTQSGKLLALLLPAVLIPALLMLVLVGGATASAQVVTNSADSGPGTLRSAITNADNGAVITFDPSLSGATITLSNTLTINTNLTIDASALPGGFKISGNTNSRVFAVASNTVVTLNSLTIQNGNAVNTGGGIYVGSGASLTLINCTLSGNSISSVTAGGYGEGGGIYAASSASLTLTNCALSGNHALWDGGGITVDGGTLTVNNSTFSSNSADFGGGILVYPGTFHIITHSTFSGNQAIDGGAIYSYGTLTISGSTFSGNSASGQDHFDTGGGGGIYAQDGTVTITSSTFSGNQADGFFGGGIQAQYNSIRSTLTITSSTFSGNVAGYGGGIEIELGTLTVNDSTFSGNIAGYGYGGGMEVYGDTLTVNGSTFSGNSADYGGGIYVDSPASLALTNTIVAGNTAAADTNDISGSFSGANNLTNSNPLLAPLGNYGGPTQTMPPLPGSPAIGAGSVAVNTFTTDQRGYARTQNGLIDLGAVELQSPAANPPVLENITVPAGGGNGLQFTFTNAPAADFTVLTATNVSLALTNWTVLGEIRQVAPGQYQFTDPQAATNPARFYRVRSP